MYQDGGVNQYGDSFVVKQFSFKSSPKKSLLASQIQFFIPYSEDVLKSSKLDSRTINQNRISI